MWGRCPMLSLFRWESHKPCPGGWGALLEMGRKGGWAGRCIPVYAQPQQGWKTQTVGLFILTIGSYHHQTVRLGGQVIISACRQLNLMGMLSSGDRGGHQQLLDHTAVLHSQALPEHTASYRLKALYFPVPMDSKQMQRSPAHHWLLLHSVQM